MKKYIPILIILFAATLLLFLNLGNQYLWQDEAETASLAKNILEYGFPKAFDGRNLINPTIRTGFGNNYGWRYHPWGQFYITSLSFLIFGVNTFSARLPFALLGVVNVILLYILSYRLTKQRFVANLSALLITFSVPYLLMMRQCRYYAPAVFLVLFIILFYWQFLKKRSTLTLISFSLGLVALGYTVHGMFLPVFGALSLHYLIFAFNKKDFLKVALAGILVFVSVLPWFIYSNSGTHIASITGERLWKNFEFQIRMINKYIFPAFFFIAMYPLRGILRKNWKIVFGAEEKKTLKILGIILLISMSIFCFTQERNFRYLIYFVLPQVLVSQVKKKQQCCCEQNY